MKIVRLGQGAWTVYAACLTKGACPVMDFICSLEEKRAARVLADLREFVPATSPKHWALTEFSKLLEDGIYEFRWPRKGGGTPRVLWFFDENRVVVCTNGADKKKGKLSDEVMKLANDIRKGYLEAKRIGQLTIVDADDFDFDED